MLNELLVVASTSIHLLAAILWVGGIFLVYKVFRPVALTLAPPLRLQMFNSVFSRFFPWVWVFIVLIVVSGYVDWLVRFGGFEYAPLYMKLMHLIGWVMIALFAWLYFKLYKSFKQLVADEAYAEAGSLLHNKMRPIIIVNLVLGLLEGVIGVSGPIWGMA